MTFRSRAVPCLLLLAAAAGTAFAQASRDVPGTRHIIRVEDLPPPNRTPSVDNKSMVVPRPKDALPQVPKGFTVNVFAEELGGENSPRLMALAPNGDILVADSGGSRVLVLRDKNGDGTADERYVFADRSQGLDLPFGLAFHDRWLYIASTNQVARFAYRPGQIKADGPGEVVIRDIPGRGYNQHWTRDIAFSPDGKKLYLTVGSETNVGEEGPMRAAIHTYNPDGTGYQRLAWGIRNPVGLAFNPTTRALWCTCNERDELGDDLVPDYFTSVKAGGFYGWPYFYLGKHPDPRFAGKGEALANQITVPDVLLQAHSAALGCAFYTGKRFPREYRGDAFLAFHGSWNRALRTGYKVVRVRFQNGKPVGGYEEFLTGFMEDAREKGVWGRPVGVLVAKDGALLVSDDAGHRIWRVSYGGK